MTKFTAKQFGALLASMIEQLRYSNELCAKQIIRFPESVTANRMAQGQAYSQCIGTLNGLETAGCITEADIVNFRNLAENYTGEWF